MRRATSSRRRSLPAPWSRAMGLLGCMLGTVMYGENQEEVFLGYSMGKHQYALGRDLAEDRRGGPPAGRDTACRRRPASSPTKRADLETLAQGLLEYETLSGDEIIGLLNGKTPVRDSGDDTPAPPRGSAGADDRLPARPKPGHGAGRPRAAAADLSAISCRRRTRLRASPSRVLHVKRTDADRVAPKSQ